MRMLRIAILCTLPILICSCKKDYKQLATKFERQLPDTIVVVKEQLNDEDHYVYYKNKGNTYLIRHNLEDDSDETIKPKLDEGKSVCGIYLGKNNIAFLVKDNANWYNFCFYNLKTFKFTEAEGSFYDAYADESHKTLNGYMDFDMGAHTIQYVYDFDGKEISSDEVSFAGKAGSKTSTDDILNITRPTTFTTFDKKGNVWETFILYADGTCIKKWKGLTDSEDSKNGEWRLMEKSIHDKVFRVIVVWTGINSYITWFTNDGIDGLLVNNDYSNIDEVMLFEDEITLQLQKSNESFKSEPNRHHFKVSYE